MTALLLATALGGPAAENPLPFRGIVETVTTGSSGEFPILFQSAIGTGNATHLGKFTSTWEFELDFTLDLVAIGSIVYTAANGDRLFADFIGQSDPTEDPDVISIVEVQTITGGTGRFAGATGSFIREGLANLATGVTSGSFDGTIVIPGPK